MNPNILHILFYFVSFLRNGTLSRHKIFCFIYLKALKELIWNPISLPFILLLSSYNHCCGSGSGWILSFWVTRIRTRENTGSGSFIQKKSDYRTMSIFDQFQPIFLVVGRIRTSGGQLPLFRSDKLCEKSAKM